MTNSQNKPNDLTLFYGLKGLREHWGWFLAAGILLIILGVLAIGAANFTTLATVVFFGVLLFIGGIIQAINAFQTRAGSGFFLTLLSGILYTIVGLYFITHPAISAITLTLLLAAFYIVRGLFQIISALAHRYAHWGWQLVSGIIALLLGILIYSEWPATGLWIIGLFIGIDLIMSGWLWVILSLSAKNIGQRVQPR